MDRKLEKFDFAHRNGFLIVEATSGMKIPITLHSHKSGNPKKLRSKKRIPDKFYRIFWNEDSPEYHEKS